VELGVIGPELQGLAETFDRLIEAAGLLVRGAEVGQGLYEIGLDLKRPQVALLRLLESAQRLQRVAKDRERHRRLGVDLQRSAEARDRLLRASQGPQHDTETVAVMSVARLGRDGLGDELRGPLAAAHLARGEAEEMKDVGAARLFAQDPAVDPARFREVADAVMAEGDGKHVVPGRAHRVGRYEGGCSGPGSERTVSAIPPASRLQPPWEEAGRRIAAFHFGVSISLTVSARRDRLLARAAECPRWGRKRRKKRGPQGLGT
jgi:hypothetical protein